MLGKGEAKAKVGVNGAARRRPDLTFDVTAVKTTSQVNGKDDARLLSSTTAAACSS